MLLYYILCFVNNRVIFIFDLYGWVWLQECLLLLLQRAALAGHCTQHHPSPRGPQGEKFHLNVFLKGQCNEMFNPPCMKCLSIFKLPIWFAEILEVGQRRGKGKDRRCYLGDRIS